ncbi:MAG: RHS repeat-associated core domain-containing protein [Pyrinomonadaceae bacterium]
MRLGNGKWETAQYNSRMEVTQIGLGTSSTDTSLLKLEYKYNTVGNTDNNGSMLEQKITVPTVGGSSGFTATQTYAYDGLNRLASATETISSTQTWKQEFSYDRYGNKNFVTGSGHTTTLGACPTTQCNPSFNTATNRFSSGQGYTYDANGSLTVDATGQQYTLDAENRQTVLKDGSGNNLAEYTYDGEGKRVRKLIWSSGVVTHFVYDAGGTLIEEWTTTPAPEGTKDKPSVSTTSYVYAGSRLISTETGSGTTYVTVDHLGSTRVTTDGAGNVTSRKDFMAFGEEAITPERNVGVGYGIPPVRQDYTGYEKEAESGLEFAQARFQNPVHGRFTSVDPLMASATIRNPQTFNRYTYALNSPYKFADPLGLLSQYTSGACGGGCPNGEQSLFASGGPMTSGGTDSSFYRLLNPPPPSIVIDIFFAVSGISAEAVQSQISAVRSQLGDIGIRDVTINVFTETESTVQAVLNSLAEVGRTVIVVGHSASADPNITKKQNDGKDPSLSHSGEYMKLYDGYIGTKGATTDMKTFQQFQINAKNLFFFGCRIIDRAANSLAKRFTLPNSSLVYNTGGNDGLTIFEGDIKESITAAAYIATGRSAAQSIPRLNRDTKATGFLDREDGNTVIHRLVNPQTY